MFASHSHLCANLSSPGSEGRSAFPSTAALMRLTLLQVAIGAWHSRCTNSASLVADRDRTRSTTFERPSVFPWDHSVDFHPGDLGRSYRPPQGWRLFWLVGSRGLCQTDQLYARPCIQSLPLGSIAVVERMKCSFLNTLTDSPPGQVPTKDTPL
jgi:hypothetical protein